MAQHHGNGAKRTASAAPLALEPNAKLLRVARALDNATRVGSSFATGCCERFPLPTIAFKGDDDAKPLLLPLWHDDVQRIKARARVCQHHAGVDAAWEMDGDALVLRNPRWRAFVDEIGTSMRDALGIAPAAVVTASLRKMMLVETGAHIQVQRRSGGDTARQRDGMFGSLVVALPGGFEGGELVVQATKRPKQHDDEAAEYEGGGTIAAREDVTQETITWRPGSRVTAFDLLYAVLYDHCSYETKAVTRGAALCLVYDLATSTPSEVPLYASPSTIQHAVDDALFAFFDVTPVPLAKRHRISPDALRTINEFGAERHFVHLVDGEAWDDLHGYERKIAERLAAFCAQSRGDYVLYLAEVWCCRRVAAHNKYPLQAEKVNSNVSVTLKAPWVKYGQSHTAASPPVFLRHHANDVLPIGRVDEFALSTEHRVRDRDFMTLQILEELHGYQSKDYKRDMAIYVTQALVVQPALVELRQLASLPFVDAAAKIRSSLPDARDDAMQYVRRIFHHRTEWHVRITDRDGFTAFVTAIVGINDLQLFQELLRTLHLEAPQTSLHGAVEHFGWEACTEMLVACITTSPTLRGRVNLLLSTVARSDSPTRAGPLFDALLALHPWTAVRVPDRPNGNGELPKVHDFGRLLQLGFVSSPQTLLDLVSVINVQAMVELVAPALIGLVQRFQRRGLREALDHVWALYEPMMPAIRNACFTDFRVPEHCDKCGELQAFLWSTATEARVEGVDAEQQKHVIAVLERVTQEQEQRHVAGVHERVTPWRTLVRVTYPEEAEKSTCLQLTKCPVYNYGSLYWNAQEQQAQIRSLLTNAASEDEGSDEEDEEDE